MKFIYNEEEAKKKKEEVEQKFWEDMKKEKKWTRNVLFYVIGVTVLFAALLGVCLWFSYYDVVMSVFGAFGTLVLGGGFAVLLLVYEPAKPGDIEYPEDVQWYIETSGYNVLEAEFVKDDADLLIYAVFEDRQGVVERKFIVSLPRKVSTKVNEETVDLPNGTYWVPYRGEKGENNETDI